VKDQPEGDASGLTGTHRGVMSALSPKAI